MIKLFSKRSNYSTIWLPSIAHKNLIKKQIVLIYLKRKVINRFIFFFIYIQVCYIYDYISLYLVFFRRTITYFWFFILFFSIFFILFFLIHFFKGIRSSLILIFWLVLFFLYFVFIFLFRIVG